MNGRDVALSTEKLKSAFLPNAEIPEEEPAANIALAHDTTKNKLSQPKKIRFAPIHT